MYVLAWALLVVVGYLSGSVSFALIITRWRSGKDIRTIGNRNAGAANVQRNIGLRWGTLVFFLDVLKSLIPMYLASQMLSSIDGCTGFGAVLSVGVAAFVGHCRPIYHGFRGGRGIATSLGTYGWFVPLELISAMFIAAGLVLCFVHNVKHRLGPYTPMGIVLLTPLLTLFTTLFLDVRLTPQMRAGAHPWYVAAGMFFFSLVIFAFNFSFVRERFSELRTSRSEGSASGGRNGRRT